jgi:hypothetical protein
MRKSLLVSAAVAGLGLASAAQAAIIVTTPSAGTPANGAVVANGYTAYVLHLSSTSGNITAVDFSASGRGMFGGFIQRWTDPDSPDGTGNYTVKSVTSTARNATASAANLDSHFLPPGGDVGNMLVGSALVETNNISGNVPGFPTNTLNTAFGTGTSIVGAYGIAAAAQSTELDIAYLILPNGVSGNFSASIAVASGAPIEISGPIPIPEPVAMSLAGLGAVGLMARRRRA